MVERVARAAWWAALAMVIVGELLPGASAPMKWVGETGISDKVLHFGAYLVLAGIPVYGFARPRGVRWALAMIALGAALELAQKLVPGRSFEWGDMLANTAGVLTGMAAGWVARKHES
jgi:hypothetical protein